GVEAVAEGGVAVVPDAVEEGEGRLLPGGVLADPLRPGGATVVAVRVDVARPPGPPVEGEAAARRLGEHPAVAHRVGEHAHLETGRLEVRGEVAGALAQGVDQ